jgi:GxxExxY protein
LHTRTIPFVAQPELTINYKGVKLSQSYRPDLICHEKTIIEIKAVNDLRPEHQAQTLNYLKATGIRLALLVNFGCHSKVTIRRLVL